MERMIQTNLTMIAWVTLLAASIGCGASIVAVLVVRKRLELPFAAAGGLFMLTSLLCSGYIAAALQRTDAVFYSMAFIVAGVAGGYALAASLVLRLGTARSRGGDATTSATRANGTHAILVACIDSRTYDPRDTAAVLTELTETGLLEVSLGVLPLLFFAQKARYRAAGDLNPAYDQLSALTERLQRSLGDSFTVSWATCSGDNALIDRVAALSAQGVGDMVVCRLGVADPPAMVQAMREVDALVARTEGLAVRFTDNLMTSQRLVSMVTESILDIADNPAETGVALVGHGQAEDLARTYPQFDEDEVVFLNRIRAQLVERGLAENHVRVAWNEWREPDVTETVRHLAALDCKRVVVVPAVWPLDTIATRLDIELASREARTAESTQIVTIAAWGDDERVVEELRVRILAASEPESTTGRS
jgi:protoheme ferro-lyase